MLEKVMEQYKVIWTESICWEYMNNTLSMGEIIIMKIPCYWSGRIIATQKKLVLLSTDLRLDFVGTPLKHPIAETLTSFSRDKSSIDNAVYIHFVLVWNEDLVWYEKEFLQKLQVICWWMTYHGRRCPCSNVQLE